MNKHELEALAVVLIKSVVRQIDVEELSLTVAQSLDLSSDEEQELFSALLTKRDTMEYAVTL